MTNRQRSLGGWCFLPALAALACGGGGDGGTGPGDQVIAVVELTPGDATLAPGATVQLTATPKNASGAAITGYPISWVSDETSVAGVSSEGLVTAVADGVAHVEAVVGIKAATATITVHTPVHTVEVTPTGSGMLNGTSVQFTATPRDAAGHALDRPVTWSTSAAAIATVSSTGLVTGIAPGTATVTATSEGKSGTAAITVVVIDYGGEWHFIENFTDAALDLTCNDQGTLTITPDGATFTGSTQQTGECTLAGSPFDNSGTFAITDGFARADSLGFSEPGTPTCVYLGKAGGAPPAEASGEVTCQGEVEGLGTVNATGTWEITRGISGIRQGP